MASMQGFGMVPGLPLGEGEVTEIIDKDLIAFSEFVRQELVARQLFGIIARTLIARRPDDEVSAEIDIVAGKVGLEVAELTGTLPERFTDPHTPMIRKVHYPSVQLKDGTFAVLAEDLRHESDINSPVESRVPWLYILDAEAHAQFQDREYAYLSDIAEESYCRYDLDVTGETDEQPPFHEAHRLFFTHPVDRVVQEELLADQQKLVEDQHAYVARMRAVAAVVLGPEAA